MKYIFIFLLVIVSLYGFLNCKKENENFYKDYLFYTPEEVSIIFNADTSISLQIINESSETLKKISKKVKIPNDTSTYLAKRMIKTLKFYTSYSGLSAPEVGLNRTILIIKRIDKSGSPYEVFVNPEIISHSSSQTKINESCIINPNATPTPVYRYNVIVVKYYDLKGIEHSETFEGQIAYTIQHHLDHFKGKTLSDYDNPYIFTQKEIDSIMSGNDDDKMRILLITNYEDSLILRKKSIDVYPDSNNIVLRRLINRMKKTLDVSGGVGIAAPQVGINRNIIWVKRMDKPGQPFEVYLNPKIVLTTQNTIQFNGDGCLSIPGQSGKTIRWPSIGIEYDLLDGKHYSEVVYGYQAYQFTAVIFQHEIDHLNGILFIDRLVGRK